MTNEERDKKIEKLTEEIGYIEFQAADAVRMSERWLGVQQRKKQQAEELRPMLDKLLKEKLACSSSEMPMPPIEAF